MKNWKRVIGIGAVALSFGCMAGVSQASHSTQLHQVTWKGKKWEYLVEHPTDVQHVDKARFEEVLDTAGQHGWELVAVTDFYHFYAFLFKRPLPEAKLTAHRARLKNVKSKRAAEEALIMKKTIEVHREKLAFEKKYAQEINETNRQLAEQLSLEEQAIALTKQQEYYKQAMAKKEAAIKAYEAEVRARLAKEAAAKKALESSAATNK